MKKSLLILPLILTLVVMAQPMDKMDLINKAKKEVGEMTPKKLKHLLDEEEDVIVLDVRESEQRSEGDIPSDEMNEENFISITRGNLEWEVASLLIDKDVLIVTYCRKGGRGALAAEVLIKMGYKNATTLKGGLKGWAKAGYPIQTGLGTTILKINKDKQ